MAARPSKVKRQRRRLSGNENPGNQGIAGVKGFNTATRSPKNTGAYTRIFYLKLEFIHLECAVGGNCWRLWDIIATFSPDSDVLLANVRRGKAQNLIEDRST
jgi:hypothetical protein